MIKYSKIIFHDGPWAIAVPWKHSCFPTKNRNCPCVHHGLVSEIFAKNITVIDVAACEWKFFARQAFPLAFTEAMYFKY